VWALQVLGLLADKKRARDVRSARVEYMSRRRGTSTSLVLEPPPSVRTFCQVVRREFLPYRRDRQPDIAPTISMQAITRKAPVPETADLLKAYSAESIEPCAGKARWIALTMHHRPGSVWIHRCGHRSQARSLHYRYLQERRGATARSAARLSRRTF